MNTILLITQHSDTQRLASEYKGFRDFKILYMEKKYSASKWNKNNKNGIKCILVDYPIETQFDLDIILQFINSISINRPCIYYAPRPNSYINVTSAALLGSMVKLEMKQHTAIIIKEKIRWIISKLPSVIQRYIYLKLYAIWNKIRYKRKIKTKIENKEPKEQLPKSLCNSSLWIEWKPSLDILKHDLIDRIGYFFPHPKSMHIAILNYCNLKCIMCPYHSPDYKKHHTSGYFDSKKMLSIETFKQLAEYAGKYKISLQFGQIEEALMHPEIFKFISLSKEKGVPYIHLTTNGTLLTKEKATQLAQSGVDSVMFSIDSVLPDTYHSIRGFKLDILEKNVEYFIQHARKHNIKTSVSFIRQPFSQNQQQMFLQHWKDKGIDQVIFYVLSNYDKQTGECIRTEQFRTDEKRYSCAAPWLQSVIMPDGNVGLCCKTICDIGWKITSVGNINQQNFHDIWFGELYQQFRSESLDMIFKKFTTCSSCNIWSATTTIQEGGDGYIRDYNETMESITFLR